MSVRVRGDLSVLAIGQNSLAVAVDVAVAVAVGVGDLSVSVIG